MLRAVRDGKGVGGGEKGLVGVGAWGGEGRGKESGGDRRGVRVGETKGRGRSRKAGRRNGGIGDARQTGEKKKGRRGQKRTLVHVVVFPAPCNPTIISTWVLPLTGCHGDGSGQR